MLEGSKQEGGEGSKSRKENRRETWCPGGFLNPGQLLLGKGASGHHHHHTPPPPPHPSRRAGEHANGAVHAMLRVQDDTTVTSCRP